MTLLVRQFEVSRLNVELFDEALVRYRPLVSDLSFMLHAGQGLGITGESGSGKTTLSLALSGLLPPGARVSAERFHLDCAGNDSLDWSGSVNRGANQLGKQLEALRGRHLFTLFQEPRASLNPYRTVGWQLRRCLRQSGDSPRAALLAAQPSAALALSSVGLDPDVAGYYPHELSTGMCQRVFLAMASILGARVLIADEPFASVDSSTQQRLSELVREWMSIHGLILILVSHDLELLRSLTDWTLVLYRGQVAESGPTGDVLSHGHAVHPYTWLLGRIHDTKQIDAVVLPPERAIRSGAACYFAARCEWADTSVCIEEVPVLREAVPGQRQDAHGMLRVRRLRCVRHPITPSRSPVGARESGFTERPSRTADSRGNTIRHDATLPPDAPSSAEVLRVRGLSKEFRTGWFRRTAKSVLQDVEFALRAGERLGIMGPSGQGKTTLARILLGLLPPTEGSVQLAVDRQWLEVSHARHSERSRWRQRIQMLYQDSDLVLDPASSIADSLVEAYHVFQPRLSKHACQRLAVRLLEELALPASVLDAFPYRLSGGERKRVALARALAALGCPFPAGPNDPWRVLVLDEPTAGVDVVLQAILGQFLLWVQPRLRLCYLVISHDELFVARFCHRARRLVNGRLISDNDQPMEFDHAESRL